MPGVCSPGCPSGRPSASPSPMDHSVWPRKACKGFGQMVTTATCCRWEKQQKLQWQAHRAPMTRRSQQPGAKFKKKHLVRERAGIGYQLSWTQSYFKFPKYITPLEEKKSKHRCLARFSNLIVLNSHQNLTSASKPLWGKFYQHMRKRRYFVQIM